MAVYQHTYQQYAGPATPLWSRFLIIPRYAYQSVFQSKLFTGLFAVCFAPLLVMTILIYLKHNLSVLEAFGASVSDIGFDVGAFFFRIFVYIQAGLAFILTVIIGPVLLSRDLANNALPLYLCRPLTRTEYVLGKMSVLLILLSLLTWIPLLLLFGFQAYLEGGGWLWNNIFIARAICLTCWAWIVLLALLSVTFSAWVKWRLAASALLFIFFIAPMPMTATINEIFFTNVGTLLNPLFLMIIGMNNLFRMETTFLAEEGWVPPIWLCWGVLVTLAFICVGLLSLKVRAYEVVK
jgi:ABC-2 type transport system permease protein